MNKSVSVIAIAALACVLNSGAAVAKDAQLRLVDPTRPLGAGTSATRGATPVLSSILHGAERKVAIINGRRLGVGEAAGGVKVLTINAKNVVVVHGGQQKTLSLHGRRVKRPAQ